MVSFWKKSNKETPVTKEQIENLKVSHKSDELRKTEEGQTFLNDMLKFKKEVLPKDVITREELLKEIEKKMKNEVGTEHNPFKTREDFFITFYDSTMKIKRRSVPFEEIEIDGRSFLIHKEFRNGEIIIKELYPYPQLEINLEEETANKESTKRQLEKINQQLLYIKNQIASGKEKYKLIDIEDLKEEKIALEKVLESIKYGKTAIFHYQDPINMRQHLWMKNVNGEYRFLKITESGHIVEENNVRMIKGNNVRKRVEDIVNLRKKLNLKGILISILVFLVFCFLSFGAYKLITFDEVLFDKRVSEGISDRTKGYIEQIDYLKKENEDLKKEIPLYNRQNPNFAVPN
jgi:cell division protein FtsB